MAKLCIGAEPCEKYLSKTSFGDALRRNWFTHEDAERYQLDVTTHNKRWVGGWPFYVRQTLQAAHPDQQRLLPGFGLLGEQPEASDNH